MPSISCSPSRLTFILVLRVEGISSDAPTYTQIKIDNTVHKTGLIDADGTQHPDHSPTWQYALISSGTFAVEPLYRDNTRLNP